MRAYKITPKGLDGLPDIVAGGMYVHEHETTEIIKKLFKSITTGDCPLKWEVEEIEILSSAEVGYQLLDGFDTIFDKQELDKLKNNE